MDKRENMITVQNAVKKYGKGENELYALNHVDLNIGKGDICVILGPSGSGKSTLLNMLGGLDSLDEGNIVVDGVDITKLGRKELVAFPHGAVRRTAAEMRYRQSIGEKSGAAFMR